MMEGFCISLLTVHSLFLVVNIYLFHSEHLFPQHPTIVHLKVTELLDIMISCCSQSGKSSILIESRLNIPKKKKVKYDTQDRAVNTIPGLMLELLGKRSLFFFFFFSEVSNCYHKCGGI